MFYTTELLSLNSNTEISILYHISTAKKNRVNTRRVVSIDVSTVIQNIKNPEIPFALRLYSYLLKGIVKVFKIKIEFYIKKGNELCKITRTKRRQINNNLCNNLRIEEYIEEISDLVSLEAMRDTSFDGFEGVSNASIEAPRNTSDTSLNIVQVRNLRKRIKIDTRLILDESSIFNKKFKIEEIEMPNLIGCFILQEFMKMPQNEKIAEFKNAEFEISQDFGDFSVQEFENCKTDFRAVDSEIQKKARWFWDLLVDAASGRVQVYQEHPFSDIIVSITN